MAKSRRRRSTQTYSAKIKKNKKSRSICPDRWNDTNVNDGIVPKRYTFCNTFLLSQWQNKTLTLTQKAHEKERKNTPKKTSTITAEPLPLQNPIDKFAAQTPLSPKNRHHQYLSPFWHFRCAQRWMRNADQPSLHLREGPKLRRFSRTLLSTDSRSNIEWQPARLWKVSMLEWSTPVSRWGGISLCGPQFCPVMKRERNEAGFNECLLLWSLALATTTELLCTCFHFVKFASSSSSSWGLCILLTASSSVFFFFCTNQCSDLA